MRRDGEEIKRNTLFFLRQLTKKVKLDGIEVISVGQEIDTTRTSMDGVTVSHIPTGVETITITYRNKKEAE